MDKPISRMLDETPGLAGPDYVALVIEWDDLADTIERELATETTKRIAKPRINRLHAIAAAAGALGVLGVLALAGWGIHRLRAA